MPSTRRPNSGRPVAFVAALLAGSIALVAVVLALSATEPSPFTSRGVPGALGVIISASVALLGGPLAGVLVAVIGALAFAFLVADGPGGFVAIGVWALAALLAGMIADRYRAASRERDLAHAAERRARQAAESESERLTNLQALTARLATAGTVREVGEALVDSVIGAFGATAAGIVLVSDDGTEFVSVVARGYDPGLLERWSRFPIDTPVILADALSRRSVVTVGNAAEALERYPMLGTLGPEYPLGAQAAAPLLAADATLGVIGINFDRARRFTLEDEALLLAIGRQCGQAIERALLFEAERRGRERAMQLRELASALTAASTLGEIAEIASDRVYPLLGGRTGIVGALSVDGEAIELVTEDGSGAEGTGPIERIPLSSGRPEAEVIQSENPLLLGSPDAMRASYPDGMKPEEGSAGGAWAGIPLKASGRTIGIVCVGYADPQAFDDRQVVELQSVADQLALALERSMLQRAREEAVRLDARVERVKAVSEAMNPGLDVGEVAAAILAEAAEALGAAAGGLGVVTPDGRDFEFMSRIGSVEGTATSVPVETSGPTTDAFRTGKVVRIEHADDWRRAYPKGSPLLGEFAESVLSVPISAAGRRIGAIGLRFDRERSFSPDELRFVGALAEEAGEALERARLFEAEQRALRRGSRLQEVTARLSRAVTMEDAARAILRAATAGVGGDAAAIALAEDDGRSLRVVPGQMSRGTLRLRPPFDLPVTDHGALAHTYRSGRTQWIESEAAWSDRFAEDLEALRVLGTCMYAVPIVSRGEPIGTLAVFFRNDTPEPSSEDAELIRSFAQQAGVALERARTYEVEHEAAVTLQRNLMPEKVAHEPTVEVVSRYLPATRGVHVGGDWYDLVDRPDGSVALAVGDIAGHGLPAAAAMGQVRSAWRALALSSGDPAAILTSLDRFAAGVEGAFFSTILTMLLDPSTNELRYASAGHPPTLVIDADRTSRFLEGGRSVPLGLPFDMPRPQAVEILSPGAVLVLYTDGLIERRDESLDEGLQRLQGAAARVAGAPLKEVADTLLDLVAEDRLDDVALLAVGPKLPAEVFRRIFPADAKQLASMRSELRAWLDRSGLPPETKEDVVLACTEAASNAIEHAYIGRDGDIRVVGETENGWLKIEVSDDGRWRDPRPDDARGRGLELVRTLIGDIDVERGEQGTTVRMRVGVA